MALQDTSLASIFQEYLMLVTESYANRPTYFRPVCEYTFTEPSCIPTAQKEFVAFKVNAGEGR